jgi:uncharacterized membrane protein YbhN (UPF0104 family)
MSTTLVDQREWSADKAAFAAITSSFILCFISLGLMLWLAGPWDVIAQTRVLTLLIDAGVIPLSEDDPGIGDGVPSIRLWIQSQEPVIWRLVIFAAALFASVSVLKSLQFHYILSSEGVPGTAGEHFKIYLYGHALGRLLPFRTGEAAWAAALMEKHKVSLDHLARAISVFKAFTIFELATFSFIGLLLMDVFMWALSLLAPLTILLICWLVMKGASGNDRSERGRLGKTLNSISSMAEHPQLLARLVLLSLISFFLVEFASYIVPQAFATVVVRILSNDLGYVVLTPSILIMSVIGGYIARLVQITPGGIGQFEWGMVSVMVVNGLPFTHAVSVTLLICAVRYISGAIIFIGLLLGYGSQASMRDIFGLMRSK